MSDFDNIGARAVDQLTCIDMPFDTSPLRRGGPLCPPARFIAWSGFECADV
jgi:hypothetical protein